MRRGLLIFVLLIFCVIAQAVEQESALFEERLIATAPTDITVKDVWFSHDCNDVVYTAQKGEKWILVHDDKQSEQFDEIRSSMQSGFLSNGKLGFWAARDGEKWQILRGLEPEGDFYDEIIYRQIHSPDPNVSKRLDYPIYVAKRNGKFRVILRENESEAFDEIGLNFFITSDGKSVLWPGKKNDKWFMGVNTETGYEIDRSPFVEFSPDGLHYAYQGINGEKQFVVIDGKKQQEYDYVNYLEYTEKGVEYDASEKFVDYRIVGDKKFIKDRGHVYRPDGELIAYVDPHVGYIRRPRGSRSYDVPKPRAVIRGRKGPEYNIIFSIVGSDDGKTVAYEAVKSGEGKRWLVVVEDKEGEYFDQVGGLIISPDGKKVVYDAKEGEQWFLVINGNKAKKRFDIIGNKMFAPDRTVVYEGIKGDKSVLMIGDKQYSKPFDVIGWPPVFSPDSKTVAYIANFGGSRAPRPFSGMSFVYVNDKKGEVFDEISWGPVFAPDGKTVVYRAMREDKTYIVVGEKEPQEVPRWEKPKFIPETGVITYKAKVGDSMAIVVGEQISETFERFDSSIFSPDGKKVAYLASKDNKTSVLVGTNILATFDAIGPITFSQDSKKLAFGVRDGSEFRWKVLDIPEN